MKFLTSLVLIILVSLTYSIDCFGRGINHPIYGCSCFSGSYGNYCNFTSPGTCQKNTPSKLQVAYLPEMDPSEGLQMSSYLKIKIRTPIVNNRYETKVNIQFSDQAYCQFPGPYGSEYFISSYPCYGGVQLLIPWYNGNNKASNCSWEVTQNSNEEIYSGVVYVSQKEDIGTIGGQPLQRTVKSAFPIRITFKKSISITSSVQYNSSLIIDAAVTKLEYVKGPPQYGIIEFTTSVNYPNKIIPTWISTPSGLSATVTDISSPCPNNGPCIQTFRMIISISSACSFTGSYAFNFGFGCQGNQACSPQQPTNITFNINSEDFCTTTGVNIGLSGYITAYKNELHTLTSAVFEPNSFVYFKAFMSATSVQLKSVNITRVHWTSGNETRVLFDNRTLTADGILEEFSTAGDSFKFKTLSSHFTMPSGSSVQVSANVVVGYFNSANLDYFEMILSGANQQDNGPTDFQSSKISGVIEIQQQVSGAAMNVFNISLFLLIFALFQ
jgi:hypothetical protein